MKKLLFFFFLYLAYNSYSQVGIGNSTPRGGLDINRPTTNTYGLVLPANPLTTNMRNPQGGAIAAATTMFDTTNDCIRFFRQNAWSNCLLTENVSLISKVEQASTFNGTYKQNVAMVTANTYTIGIKNESPTAVSITLSPLDLKLSGVSGLSVASVSPTSVTIQPGQTSIATYRIAGTPTNCGELIGTWKKIKIDHTATTNVIVNPTYACDLGSWKDSVLPEYRLTGLVPGESYTGTYTIPYTNGGECPLAPEAITNKGLTLTYAGGPLGPSGEITYTLSGTYTGAADDGTVYFTTASGCVAYLGPSSSCNEILDVFPNSTDGVYLINPDKELTAFPSMYAQCDMTTDGGGWTMVLNYLHLGGTNPAITARNTTPLLGSSTLGENEATNTTTWGNANRALQLALAPTEYRFYGIVGSHSRVMHFKTAHAGSVTFFTRGTGTASGIQTSFTPLDGHTANLPATANTFGNGGVDKELTGFPFYTPSPSHTFQYHWNVGSARWEVDNTVNSNGASTLHRVWVR